MRNLIVALLVAGVIGGCNRVVPSPPVATPGATLAPTVAPTEPAATVEPAATLGPTATPVETDTAGTPQCEPSDLKASHGLVEASGDSRLTEVVLVSAGSCSVNLFPAVGLRDAAGTATVDSPSAGPGRLDLVADIAYRSQVRLASWCAPEPAFPVTLVLVVADGSIEVTGSSFPEDGALSPCSPDGATLLEASAWNPVP